MPVGLNGHRFLSSPQYAIHWFGLERGLFANRVIYPQSCGRFNRHS